MPTRRITRSPVKVTGTAPDDQQFESKLEEDFFVLLRFNHLVAEFESQAVTIDWEDDQKTLRKYTPDVLVRYRKDIQESAEWPPVLYEVKPDEESQSGVPSRYKPPRYEDEAENALKWAAAKRYSLRQGWEFKVVRESEIRTPYLDNARFLLRHLERGKPSQFDDSLLAWLSEKRVSTLHEWSLSVSNGQWAQPEILPACYRLIATRQVLTDLVVLLSLKSEVRSLPNA